jgi:hypothetical protein
VEAAPRKQARNRARFCDGIDEGPAPVGLTARLATGRFEISEQKVL